MASLVSVVPPDEQREGEDLAAVLAHLRALPAPTPLEDYLGPFTSGDEPFLCFHDFLSSKEEVRTCYSRGEFWRLVRRCVATLLHSGLMKGDSHVHYFSGNSVVDLAMRTGSVVLGTVPVTVNWQADTAELVAYKIAISRAKLVVTDERTPPGVLSSLREQFPACLFVSATEILITTPHADICSLVRAGRPVAPEDTRCVIFTSGTTGKPKGVQLSYANYSTNRSTFESFLQLTDPSIAFTPLCVNPMHHTNSTSLTDWALRRPGTTLHLVEHYTTQYWNILVGVHGDAPAAGDEEQSFKRTRLAPPGERVVVAPLVSRHIDFLETLFSAATPSIRIDRDQLSKCLSNTILLLGSAPVGPTTVSRLLEYARRLPTVRFGSTETTLQVCGIPVCLAQEYVVSCFQRGWAHTHPDGSTCQGFYIGREHSPFTEVDIVKSVVRGEDGFMERSPAGVPGYIVTRGGHVFKSYVGLAADVSASAKSADGWYLNLGDIGFWLPSTGDDDYSYKEIYWQSRDSQMLIRGGANYAFEQVNAELKQFVSQKYELPLASFSLAVCGIRVLSEHEDECCVVLQLHPDELPLSCGSAGSLCNDSATDISSRSALLESVQCKLQESFLNDANRPDAGITKGAKPNRFALSDIPMVASKGVVNVPALVKYWKDRAESEKK